MKGKQTWSVSLHVMAHLPVDIASKTPWPGYLATYWGYPLFNGVIERDVDKISIEVDHDKELVRIIPYNQKWTPVHLLRKNYIDTISPDQVQRIKTMRDHEDRFTSTWAFLHTIAVCATILDKREIKLLNRFWKIIILDKIEKTGKQKV